MKPVGKTLQVKRASLEGRWNRPKADLPRNVQAFISLGSKHHDVQGMSAKTNTRAFISRCRKETAAILTQRAKSAKVKTSWRFDNSSKFDLNTMQKKWNKVEQLPRFIQLCTPYSEPPCFGIRATHTRSTWKTSNEPCGVEGLGMCFKIAKQREPSVCVLGNSFNDL